MAYTIEAYRSEQEDAVLGVTMRSWAPVFPKMREATPGYVYDAFYPEGWEARQTDDVTNLLRDEAVKTWVAVEDGAVIGFVGVRIHPEDSMGEIHIVAVDPAHQRRGISHALMQQGFDYMREQGMVMAMVETGGDPGHAPSRATYEAMGFDPWPVARYFKKLDGS